MSPAAAVIAAGVALLGRTESASNLEVSVAIDRCLALPAAEVMRLTALELEADVVMPRAASPGATRVTLTCNGRRVRLHVADPVTGKELERTLAVNAREADVRGRAVALAIAELVLTSWMELTLPEPPPESADFDRPSSETRREAEERVRRRAGGFGRLAHLLALAQAVGPFDGLSLGWGGGIRLGYVSNLEWLGVHLDLIAARSVVSTELGTVRATNWSATLGPSLLLRIAPAWLEAGAGLRFGIGRLEGTPAEATEVRGASVVGTWSGPALCAGAGVAWSHFVLALGIEAGYVLRSVSGAVVGGQVDGQGSVSIDGGWLAGTFGVGWAP
ncbi:MAG TPA: hypothetical protein VF989_09560 [Polyangiaceae bacterium]